MLSKSEKSLATVQLYLYTKYLLRINEFRLQNVNKTASDKKTLALSPVKEDWGGVYWENGVEVGWEGGHFRPASEASGVIP